MVSCDPQPCLALPSLLKILIPHYIFQAQVRGRKCRRKIQKYWGHKEIIEGKCFASKGQLISKANCQAVSSSKKRTNEIFFTTMRRVFVCFLEEIEDTKKKF